MMDLILWRHAEAEEADDGRPDLERKLTARGERQATRVALWLHLGKLSGQCLLQLFETLIRSHRSRDDRRLSKGGVAQLRANLFDNFVRRTQITLRQHDDCAIHAEVEQDLQMLFSLRHPTVVRGYD